MLISATRKAKEILHDINIRALSGEKVAFVGATGAGKTTITNLINRFYDITAGSITYDGIDISRIKKRRSETFHGYSSSGCKSVYGNSDGEYQIR